MVYDNSLFFSFSLGVHNWCRDSGILIFKSKSISTAEVMLNNYNINIIIINIIACYSVILYSAADTGCLSADDDKNEKGIACMVVMFYLHRSIG